MLRKLFTVIIVMSTNFQIFSRASDNCDVVSSKYFKWLDPNGSLNLPIIQNDQLDNEDVCVKWKAIEDYEHCKLCVGKTAVVCDCFYNSSLPSANNLPTNNLSLFKINRLSSLPPGSFTGLNISRLVILNSNLSNIAPNTFEGVQSIKYLHLKYNIIGQLSKAGRLFHLIPNLNFMEFRRNDLRALSSMDSANLSNLQYFGLSESPIYDLNLNFLQNSSLQVLNLQNVKFRVKNTFMKDCGFSLLPLTLNSVDISEAEISTENIDSMLALLSNKSIATLSLGNLRTKIKINPFLLVSHVSGTLKYLTLQGTQIKTTLSLTSKEKETIFANKFYQLEEINMKNCGLEELGDGTLFQAFPKLTVISFSGNNFVKLNLRMFTSFNNLNYLDLSSNNILSIANNSEFKLTNLQILDLSDTIIDLEELEFTRLLNTAPFIQELSLCNASITSNNIMALKNLEYLKLLDLSGTVQKSSNMYSAYRDLFSSNLFISELHFSRNEFDTESNFSLMFSKLTLLKSINLSKNLIRTLSSEMFAPSVETLKLSSNYITTWYSSISKKFNQLKYLDLQENQISYVNSFMLQDFNNLRFLNLNFNPLTCHNKVLKKVCNTITNRNSTNSTGSVWKQNQCYDLFNKTYRHFYYPEDCSQYFDEVYSEDNNQWTLSPRNHSQNSMTTTPSLTWVYFVVGVTVGTTVIGSMVYVRRWHIRCFIHRYLSLRRVRLLKKKGEALTRADIQYDVFVSYSDIDRSWVLDYLIPNMEADGDISVCFHERDFQVGLSILENIIECMDRSNAILLIVSEAFVRSKWCQFEMHLAQHRLIETYKEQLVLVLLEDIPRKTRPQTLHHLMMTKTYINWPLEPCKEESRELFWKRLKRSLKPTYNIFDA